MSTRKFDILRLGVGLAHMVRCAELHLSTPKSPKLWLQNIQPPTSAFARYAKSFFIAAVLIV